MTVNTFIMGTQKGGTTALFEFLRTHPMVAVPDAKEAHFFDNDSRFKGESVDYETYHRRFASMDAPVRLDATPIYMYWRPVRDRLFAYNPDAKLIFLLRDPSERARSHWEMEFSRGNERASFEKAIEGESRWLARNPGRQHRVRSYVDRGYYARQIKRMLARFRQSQMLFVTTEQLRSEHCSTLDRVCGFIGLPRFDEYPRARSITPLPKISDLPSIDANSLRNLRPRFSDDLRELMEITGIDVSAWMG